MRVDRRTWPRRTAYAVLLAVTGLAAFHLLDMVRRDATMRLVATDPKAAAARLVATGPARGRAACGGETRLGDLRLLAEAIVRVETLATSVLEHTFETLVVRAALAGGLPVPYYSIGPAQIRTSTAAAAAAAEWAHTDACLGVDGKHRIARDLLSPARAIEWTSRVLAMYAQREAIPLEPLDRSAVLRLTAVFNGQETSSDGEAAVAHHLYRELVYNVYQELRFEHRTGAGACAHATATAQVTPPACAIVPLERQAGAHTVGHLRAAPP